MTQKNASFLLALVMGLAIDGCSDHLTAPPTGPFEIAFVRQPSGASSSPELFVMRADGTNQKQLTWNRNANSPSWSPDGSEIVFEAGGTERDVINVETGATRKILGGYGLVRWSPDGTRLAFEDFPSQYYPVTEIYTVSPQGTNAQRLTFDTQLAKFVGDWSPDGSRLVLTASDFNAGQPNNSLYVMGADGTGMTPITDTTSYENGSVVSWSPDGSTIAYVADGGFVGMSQVPYHWAIHTIRPDGSMVRQLSAPGNKDTNPSWSPDGKQIVFQSERDGHSQIYIMNADGSSQFRLVNSRTNDTQPEWRRR